MKKLMVMMVVLGAAVVTQAATVLWNNNLAASSFYGLTTGTKMTVGAVSETSSMVVLYLLQTDYATVTASSTRASVTALAKAKAVGQTSGNAAAAGLVGASLAPNIIGSTPGITYVARVYAVFGGKEYYLDNTTGWTTKLGMPDTNQEKLSWTAQTWGGKTGDFGTANVWVVPEPTSMALLALGVAAVGLRRKFRK